MDYRPLEKLLENRKHSMVFSKIFYLKKERKKAVCPEMGFCSLLKDFA